MRMHPRSLGPSLGLALAAALIVPSAALAAGVSVTVGSPANNANVPLTFTVAASATTSNAGAHVTGWHIYIDSVDKWGTAGPTSSINQSVSTTAGTHTLLVRAWDSTGAFGSQQLSIVAQPPTTLQPPANATTVHDLDEAITKTDGSDVQKVVDGWTVSAGSCTGACAAKAGSL